MNWRHSFARKREVHKNGENFSDNLGNEPVCRSCDSDSGNLLKSSGETLWGKMAVSGVACGGDTALRRSVESAEDMEQSGWEELKACRITSLDTVVGIAASGTTPYVIGTLRRCREEGILTASIACNPGAPVSQVAEIPIEVVTGPEYVTGSTRMKAGTAQKLVLNMISTATMIGLGRVEDNRMVHMQLTNKKLIDRGARMIAESTGLPYDVACEWLRLYGSVSRAVEVFKESRLSGNKDL